MLQIVVINAGVPFTPNCNISPVIYCLCIIHVVCYETVLNRAITFGRLVRGAFFLLCWVERCGVMGADIHFYPPGKAANVENTWPWFSMVCLCRHREWAPWWAWSSITSSGGTAAEPVRRALWPGHSQEDQEADELMGPEPAAGKARWMEAEREGRQKWAEGGRKSC